MNFCNYFERCALVMERPQDRLSIYFQNSLSLKLHAGTEKCFRLYKLIVIPALSVFTHTIRSARLIRKLLEFQMNKSRQIGQLQITNVNVQGKRGNIDCFGSQFS